MSIVTLKGTNGIAEFNPENSLVAEGGTARVFKGTFCPYIKGTNEKDHNSSQTAAIKVIFDDIINNYTIALTKRTASLNLDHPNLMKVIDFIEKDGIYHTVCEWLEGRTLEKYLEINSTVDADYAVTITKSVLDGLKALHEKRPQVIHRDVNPANIMLCNDGTAKLIDFGIAKIIDETRSSKTEIGAFLGNLDYSPPEQIAGFQNSIAPTTDIYSVGITLYEILAGEPPFGEPDLKFKHIEAPIPTNSKIPTHLFKIIQKATNKKQADRFQSAQSFIDALIPNNTYNSRMETLPEVTVSSPPPPPPKEKKKKKLAPLLAVLGLLLASSLIGFWLVSNGALSDDSYESSYTDNVDASESTFIPRKGYITGNKVRIRREPNTYEDNEITQLSKNDRVLIIDKLADAYNEFDHITSRKTTFKPETGNYFEVNPGQTLKVHNDIILTNGEIKATLKFDDSTVTGFLDKNDIEPMNSGWYKIKFKDEIGWVYGKYVKEK